MSPLGRIPVERSKQFKTSEIKNYVKINTDFPEVTVTIKGEYMPAQFMGDFEGYAPGVLSIKEIMVDNVKVESKKLLKFIEYDFLTLIAEQEKIK